jgi:Icc protein
MKIIAYITDLHVDEDFPIENGADPRRNWELILQDIRQRGISDVIFGGDIGEKETNAWFFKTLEEFNLCITLGNHDEFGEATKHYTRHIQPGRDGLYYCTQAEGFKFIFLDSSLGEISEPQLIWLQQELAAPQKLAVFIHHPVLHVDTYVDKKYPLQNRDHVRELLEHTGRDITIFCGHYHLPDECSFKNIRQFITPSASIQIGRHREELKTDTSTFGYRLIEVNGKEMNTDVMMFRDGVFE